MTTPAPPRRPPHRHPHPHAHPVTGRGTPPPGRRPAPRRTPPPGPSLIRLADPRRRATVLLVGSMVVLTLFGGRLLELQAVRGEALAAAAVDQRLRTVTIPASRGTITDSSGTPLAETVEARNVTVDQTLVTDPEGQAAQMAPWLGMPEADVQEALTGTRRFAYVAKGLTPNSGGASRR